MLIPEINIANISFIITNLKSEVINLTPFAALESRSVINFYK